MKNKVYEDENIKVFSKKEMFIGEEVEIADSLLEAGMVGYLEFAGHLKEPREFWKACKEAILERIQDIEVEIKLLKP